MLILVGVLFAVQQAGVLDFSRSWPLLIIGIGVMKLIERLVAGPAPQAPPPPAGTGPYAGPRGPYMGSAPRGGPVR